MGLIGTIVVELAFLPSEPEDRMPGPAVAISKIEAEPPRPLPQPRDEAAWKSAILARPLFDRLRRPPEPIPHREEAGTILPRLAGTLVGPNARRAILTTDRATVAVDEGGHFGIWTVTAIGKGTVTLDNSGASRTLVTTFEEAAAARAAIVAATPALVAHGRPHRRASSTPSNAG